MVTCGGDWQSQSPTSGNLLNGDLGSPSWMRFLRITEVFHVFPASCVFPKEAPEVKLPEGSASPEGRAF